MMLTIIWSLFQFCVECRVNERVVEMNKININYYAFQKAIIVDYRNNPEHRNVCRISEIDLLFNMRA